VNSSGNCDSRGGEEGREGEELTIYEKRVMNHWETITYGGEGGVSNSVGASPYFCRQQNILTMTMKFRECPFEQSIELVHTNLHLWEAWAPY
jgi:hypothetical protein